MPKLIATIGGPGAGKSTWARQQAGYHVISLDSLRPAGPWSREKHRIGLERLLRQISEYGSICRPLIVDTTGSTPTLRGAIRDAARRSGYALHAVYFDVPVTELLRRNAQRPRPVPQQHVVRIAQQLVRERAAIEREPWVTFTRLAPTDLGPIVDRVGGDGPPTPGEPDSTRGQASLPDGHKAHRGSGQGASTKALTTTQRGYGHRHQQERARWAPKVATGKVRCARCGKLIALDAPWDLGHVDTDRSRYQGPEHASCNRAAGARSRARTRPAKRQSRRW